MMPKPRQALKHILILWLISPLLSLYFSLKDIRNPKILPAFVLFSFFFGLSFVVPENVAGSADAARYAEELRLLNNSSFGLTEISNYLYNPETKKIDIYQPLTTWLISLFTDSPRWLFAVFGLVFGWFWFRNIQLVIKYAPHKMDWALVTLFILFALTNPIWQINGVRMWTAAQIFAYGVFLLFLAKRKSGYYYCAASILVHFSFIIPFALLLAYHLIPNKNTKVFFLLYVGSFTVNELNIETIRQYFEMLPDVFQSRKGYLNEAYVERFMEGRASGGSTGWHVLLSRKIQTYFFFLSTVLIYIELQFRQIKISRLFRGIFNLALFFSAFANIASNLPSGGRFYVIANTIMIVAFILFYSERVNNLSFYRTALKVAMPFLLFLIIFKIRVGFDYMGVVTILGNPIIAVFAPNEIPLIDFVKSLF